MEWRSSGVAEWWSGGVAGVAVCLERRNKTSYLRGADGGC